MRLGRRLTVQAAATLAVPAAASMALLFSGATSGALAGCATVSGDGACIDQTPSAGLTPAGPGKPVYSPQVCYVFGCTGPTQIATIPGTPGWYVVGPSVRVCTHHDC